MAKLKQSICKWCFDMLAPETLVRAAADIGYTGIELIEPEHWPLVKDHGLAIASMKGHDSIIDGMNRRENQQRIANELTASIATAAQWGIPNVICFSGSRAGLDDN